MAKLLSNLALTLLITTFLSGAALAQGPGNVFEILITVNGQENLVGVVPFEEKAEQVVRQYEAQGVKAYYRLRGQKSVSRSATPVSSGQVFEVVWEHDGQKELVGLVNTQEKAEQATKLYRSQTRDGKVYWRVRK